MKKYSIYAILSLLCSCLSDPGKLPDYVTQARIYPDYEGVTIPRTLAPLSFRVNTKNEKVKTTLRAGNYSVSEEGNEIRISVAKWHKLVTAGDTIQVEITHTTGKKQSTLHSFNIYISKDETDPYLAYRLIPPGYELWREMGIYQRSLSDYTESPIYENTQKEDVCINCHTTNQGNPEEFIFHQRPKPSGTILVKDGIARKLDTYFSDQVPALVYPSWHPSGNFIAFSVNKTKQAIHSKDPNRIEVWDLSSDIVILNLQTNQLLTTSLLMSPGAYETFPAFSPDGRTLYFCSAQAITSPDSIQDIKYDLCSIPVDIEKGIFGQDVDTLIKASAQNYSISFPRVSPDGRFLLYTQHNYGNFSIWHKEADLAMYDLIKQQPADVSILNSDESESYHSWSSNGRWIVFSSRREDGLYTRPYLAHIDEKGVASKPFLLPQKDTDYYIYQDKSYNIPEFMTGKVKNRQAEIQKLIEGSR